LPERLTMPPTLRIGRGRIQFHSDSGRSMTGLENTGLLKIIKILKKSI